MKRIDTATAEADKHGAGKDGFTNGDPGATPRTLVDADWFDGAQEEVVGAIEASGQTPSGDNLYQLLGALRMMGIHIGLNTPGVLVPDPGGATFGSALCQAGCVEPLGGRAYFCGDARQAGYLLRPYDGDLTEITPTGAGVDYNAICAFGEDLVCIVGEAEQIVTVSVATPTERNTGGTKELNAVAWNGATQLCTVGDDGMIKTAATGALGTWTNRTAGSSFAGDFSDVIWSALLSLWVAVGADREVQTSPDGITWTRRNTSAGEQFSSVVEGAAGLAAQTNAGTVWTSADGITWTAGDDAVVGVGLQYADGCMFVWDDEELCISIDDGATWITRDIATHFAAGAPGVVGDRIAFAVSSGGGASEIYRLGSMNSFGG